MLSNMLQINIVWPAWQKTEDFFSVQVLLKKYI